jgi:hypothetical protein
MAERAAHLHQRLVTHPATARLHTASTGASDDLLAPATHEATVSKAKVRDDRTVEQVESVSDSLMDRAETAYIAGNDKYAQRLRDEAIHSMLRAVLLAIRQLK